MQGGTMELEKKKPKLSKLRSSMKKALETNSSIGNQVKDLQTKSDNLLIESPSLKSWCLQPKEKGNQYKEEFK